MSRIFTLKTIFAAAAITVGTAGMASADIINIDNTPVMVTSSFNGGPSQTINVNVDPNDAPGASIEIPGSSFSWMSAGDHIDFSTIQTDKNRNLIDVFFAASDNFSSGDYVSLTFQLAPDWIITNAALTEAIDATVNDGVSIVGNTITFNIQGLDQINPLSGNIELEYFVASPEPGTIGLALVGVAALFLRGRRSL